MKKKMFRKTLAAVLGICLTASSLAFPVHAVVPGDVSGNGRFSLIDVVAAQQWLLDIRPHSKWEWMEKGYCWENGDLNGDGVLDVFDLALMKRSLTEQLISLHPLLSDASVNLMESVQSETVAGLELDEDFILNQTDFYLKLMQETAEDGTNTLISPYSISQALAMTANGADSATRSEMEQVLGGVPMEQLNQYLYTLRVSQPDEDDCKLLTANSIWFRNGEPISRNFLQTNADFYASEVFETPMNQQTIEDINLWTDAHTDHMIPTLLNELPNSTTMCLVNAVTFDAKWADAYESSYSAREWFTAADGTKQDAELLCGSEYEYLSDAHAEGFLKYYTGERYAFAALLPEEGMTTSAYLQTLTAESLHQTLANPKGISVMVTMPEFSYAYETKHLPETLQKMGMTSAFKDADFSGMTDSMNDYFISDILHKTFIQLDKGGTRAAAATAVIMEETGVWGEKSISLNRPYVYCIVDTQTDLPIFIGTVESLD